MEEDEMESPILKRVLEHGSKNYLKFSLPESSSEHPLSSNETSIQDCERASRNKFFKTNRKVIKYNTSQVLNYKPSKLSKLSKAFNAISPCSRKQKLTSVQNTSYTQETQEKKVNNCFEESKQYLQLLNTSLKFGKEIDIWGKDELKKLLKIYQLDNCELNNNTRTFKELFGKTD